MSKLDTAMTRFDRVLDRLDKAIQRRPVEDADAAVWQGQVVALKEDKAQLAEELNVLKVEADRLGVLNSRASARLAGAISGIQRVLAES